MEIASFELFLSNRVVSPVPPLYYLPPFLSSLQNAPRGTRFNPICDSIIQVMIPTWTTGFHSDYSTINLTKIRLKLRDFELKVLNLRGCSPLRQQWDTSKSPLQTCNLTWKHYRYTLRHSNAQTAIFLEKTSLLCTISSQTDLTFTQQTNFHNIRI